MTLAGSVRPLGHRPLLCLAVHFEVDALVEEADQVADRLGVAVRLRVRPGEIFVERVAGAHMPVRGEALVRAARLLLARLEELRPYVLARQVEAGREAGLEQRDRP